MAREKKTVHKVQMTDGKRQIIQQLLQEYDIETAEDIQDALKDLLGGTIKEMMEAEMDDHLGYHKSERSENESAKYWLSVLNELKNRGVKDIMIVCADGLSGIKEAIATAFPNTEYQRCLVHQVRNTLKYVPDKDRKAFAKYLKTIYNASTEEEAFSRVIRLFLKHYTYPLLKRPRNGPCHSETGEESMASFSSSQS